MKFNQTLSHKIILRIYLFAPYDNNVFFNIIWITFYFSLIHYVFSSYITHVFVTGDTHILAPTVDYTPFLSYSDSVFSNSLCAWSMLSGHHILK